jgi:hypothetical protein
MNERQRAQLVAHGALVFLVGMVAGFPFAFAILGKIALWPFSIDWTVPGDVRGWRMAHLEGVLNGLLLIGVAAVGGLLRLDPRQHGRLVAALLVTAWGNMIASIIGPIFGVRGLELGGGVANSVVFLLFMVAIVTVFVALALIYRGARAAMRGTYAPSPNQRAA